MKTPLHLFEPRYRQLAREVLAGERRIGMVVVRPEHVDDMPGDPADRIIAATSIALSAPLVTADARLRSSRALATVW